MDLVARMCFTEHNPPDNEVIDLLLGMITRESKSDSERRQTKLLTIFDDNIDGKPVVRSFLLQLLLRSQ